MRPLPEQIGSLVHRLAHAQHRPITLCTAESATSGRIADFIAQVPGASDYFLGGIVAYSNGAKHRLLHVRLSTLRRFGAVSEQVAHEMAHGGRLAFGADVCVADTGIAGPGGGSEAKPVGLFYVAIATRASCDVYCHRFEHDREGNRTAAAVASLTFVRDYLLQCCGVQE
jgi:nicotinamide-nucleotide amidase